ncbi:hypothetical protein ACWCOP_04510 [Maricaulaceae bacterium MS644]
MPRAPVRMAAFCIRRLFAAGCGALLLVLFGCSGPASAQTAGQVPDEPVLSRLVWQTLITLDNANRMNDYAMVHALGSSGFQDRNTPASLAATFQPLRQARLDVGRAVLAAPTWYEPPVMLDSRTLRLRGGFEFRPRSLRFDLVFENNGGAWRLHGVSVADLPMDAPR